MPEPAAPAEPTASAPLGPDGLAGALAAGLEASPTPAVLVDAAGTIVWANAAAHAAAVPAGGAAPGRPVAAAGLALDPAGAPGPPGVRLLLGRPPHPGGGPDRAARLDRLQAATAAFGTASSPEAVYEVVVAEAVRAAGARAGAVLVPGAGGRLELAAAVGYGPAGRDGVLALGADPAGPVGTARATGGPVVVADGVPVALAGGGDAALAVLPLADHGGGTAALVLGFTALDDGDAGDRTAFLAAVARHCASALERARLLRSEQDARRAEREARLAAERAHDRLAFLAEAGQVVAGTLDRGEILERVSRLAVPRLADLAVAYLPRGHVLDRVAIVHGDPDVERRVTEAVAAVPVPVNADGPAARCYRTGEVQAHDMTDLAQAGQGTPILRAAADIAVRDWLCVPVRVGDATVAVLAFGAIDPARLRTDDDVAVAVELAARTAMAMVNAERFEQQHTIAEALQWTVLPERLPQVPGADLAARYESASLGSQVGGDWYDAFELRDGRIGLAVGDVSGHGVDAAATMGQIRNALRAYALDGETPSAVLERLNAYLVDTTHARSEAFATAVYAAYDPAGGRLVWANAGHPPMVLKGAEVQLLDRPSGTMLGVDRKARYADGHAELHPGDALAVYTDGLVERRGESILRSIARLVDSVRAIPAGSADRLCDELVGRHTADGRRHDDTCVLVLRRP